MLNWSSTELANRSGISPVTIRRYEQQSGIPASNSNNLLKIKTTLEEAGIEFIGDPLKDPGVILHLHTS